MEAVEPGGRLLETALEKGPCGQERAGRRVRHSTWKETLSVHRPGLLICSAHRLLEVDSSLGLHPPSGKWPSS